MKTSKLPGAILALGVIGLSFICAARGQWAQSTIIAASATSFDMTVADNTTYVAYESAGNIYYTSKGYYANTWSAPVLIGSGSAPSIALNGANPVIAYVSGGVNVAVYTGASWTTTNVGDVNGTTQVMLRAADAGTLYLLNTGGGTGGRGSLDIATYSGGTLGGFTNIAYGWYDSGSGNYWHQGILATVPGVAGYGLAYEQDNWGGRASWSNKGLTTGNFSANAWEDYGWNSGGSLSTSALSYSATDAMFGCVISGNAYVDSFDGTSWTGGVFVDSASSIGVDVNSGMAVYAKNGQLYEFDTGATSSLTFLGDSVAGSSPFLLGDATTLHLLYLDGSGQLAYLTTAAIPESANLAGLAGCLALGFAAWRRRCWS